MLLTYASFILGFALLIKGADYFVDGASSLAKLLKISDLAIGLTVVAFGTSAPELTVNVAASIHNKSEIVIGNIVGSNICNILLILGLSSMINPITVKRSTVWKEIPFSFMAVAVLSIIANDKIIDHAAASYISRTDGLILLVFFVMFLVYVFGIAKELSPETVEVKYHSPSISLIMVGGGLAALILGGNIVVNSGTTIARSWGVSEGLIGFSLIAIGTSLPELFTSVVAAYKKRSDIAIGNVVGSNIFNIFWILGVSAFINPIPFPQTFNTDLLFLGLTTSILFVFMFTGTKHALQRKEGVLLIMCYCSYLWFIVMRG